MRQVMLTYSSLPNHFLSLLLATFAHATWLNFRTLEDHSLRIGNYALSRIEKFTLARGKSHVETLSHLLEKDVRGDFIPNRYLKDLNTQLVNLTSEEVTFIASYFPQIESFIVPFKLPVIATLEKFLKVSSDGKLIQNETMKILDLTRVPYDHASKRWIAEHFPNALVKANIVPILAEEEVYLKLHPGFVGLGPQKIYQIKDPDGILPSFVLSHAADARMNHEAAVQFCVDRDGSLLDKTEFEMLFRAMNEPDRYRTMGERSSGRDIPEMVPGMYGTHIWSLSARPPLHANEFFLNGNDGYAEASESYWVRCKANSLLLQ